MPMWLVHCFYIIYLFPDFIYSFRYPVVIFSVTVSISLVTSIILMEMSNFVNKQLFA